MDKGKGIPLSIHSKPVLDFSLKDCARLLPPTHIALKPRKFSMFDSICLENISNKVVALVGALYSGKKISKLLILVNRGIVLITSHVVFSFLEHYAPTIISRQSSKLCGSQSGNENCTRNPIHLLNLLSGLQRLPPLNTQKPKCLPLKNVILLL